MAKKIGPSPNLNLNVVANVTPALNSIQQVSNAGQKVAAKIDKDRLKLMTLWSYANQIGNFLLRSLSDIAEGSKYAAHIQTAMMSLQLAQTEAAILQTIQQAMARKAVHDWLGFSLLMGIAASMQYGVIRQLQNKARAKRNEEMAQDIADQIEAYSS